MAALWKIRGSRSSYANAFLLEGEAVCSGRHDDIVI
jgi:hypothetical protein